MARLEKERSCHVLGEEYTIIEDASIKDKFGADGVYADYSKTIRVRPVNDLLEEPATPEEKAARQRETIRHELIHAFMGIGGLDRWNDDEELVNWMAKMFPRVYKCFEEAECNE